MDINHNDNPKVFNGYNYYLMYKIDNAYWRCVLNNSFVLSNDNNVLTGQFLSSLWFKTEIYENISMNVIIIKLPKNSSIIYQEQLLRVIKTKIFDYETNNGDNINYNDLEFVVAYKYYNNNNIKNICDKLKTKITDVYLQRQSLSDTINYSDYDSTNDNISLKFEIQFGCIDNKNDECCEDITYAIKPPHLVRCNNSWSSYKKNTKGVEGYRYFITCPIFSINV
tara:strand:+ start:19208 stop:19879 length:672 start_codon:yes stop_codon:yes gene_type:complete